MNIKVIAQNAIKIIAEGGKTIYFDPFKLRDEDSKDADVILVTHSHFDHFSPEDIKQIKKDNTKIIVTKDLFEKALQCGFDEDEVLTVVPNKEYSFAEIEFKTIPAYNTNKDFHKREYEWVSYILNVDDVIIYIAGDTDITDEALNVECDIAMVPVGGTYTMTAEEAAMLVGQIMPRRYAVPTHYKTVVGSEEDALRFKKLLEGNVEVKIMME